ncbi:MAG: hypothetical protein WC477_04485 [Patescibacteria group bacterium]
MGRAGQALYKIETSESGTLDSKKIALRKISGSNLFFKNSEIIVTPIFPYAALLAALKNFSEVKEKSPHFQEGFSLVPLCNSILTFFGQNY